MFSDKGGNILEIRVGRFVEAVSAREAPTFTYDDSAAEHAIY
jgi:hypothetical protein